MLSCSHYFVSTFKKKYFPLWFPATLTVQKIVTSIAGDHFLKVSKPVCIYLSSYDKLLWSHK